MASGTNRTVFNIKTPFIMDFLKKMGQRSIFKQIFGPPIIKTGIKEVDQMIFKRYRDTIKGVSSWSNAKWITEKYADEEYLPEMCFLTDGMLDTIDDIEDSVSIIFATPFVILSATLLVIVKIIFFPLFSIKNMRRRYKRQSKRRR